MGKESGPPRPKYNNYNPYNKLELNKFHQIGAKAHVTNSKMLHKKKRDIERLINFKKMKNEELQPEKVEEFEKVQQKLSESKKNYEKDHRKQFFIKNKYKQIMEIEMRKINKKIRELKGKQGGLSEQEKKDLLQWKKKQRYIKFYPKNLKYVSLFPSAKPLEEKALQFQNKIMADIEETYRKKVGQRNEYKNQNVKKEGKPKKNKDNFFLAEEQPEQPEQKSNDEEQIEQEQEQEK